MGGGGGGGGGEDRAGGRHQAAARYEHESPHAPMFFLHYTLSRFLLQNCIVSWKYS